MSAASETSQKLYTAEDLERLSAQGYHYELIRGELKEMSPTGDAHGYTTYLVTLYLGMFIEEHNLGKGYGAETGFQLANSPDTVLAPDFAFVAKGRQPDTVAKTYAPFVPDLVLETRSPNDTKKEVAEKVQRWLQAGVRMALELDPKSRVLTVYRPGKAPRELGADAELSGEDVLPGFALPMRKLFPES
jgi:Uma2 family endonuclease